MTNQHRATPDEWAQQEDWANRSVFSGSSCLLELRDRVEALDATQQPPRDKIDRLIALDRDDPPNSLVDRIATDAELCQVYNEKTTLRAVYDLGREHGAAPAQPGPGSSPAGSLVERICVEAGIHNPADARAAILEVAAALLDWWDSDEVARTGWEAAKWLEQEANQ